MRDKWRASINDSTKALKTTTALTTGAHPFTLLFQQAPAESRAIHLDHSCHIPPPISTKLLKGNISLCTESFFSSETWKYRWGFEQRIKQLSSTLSIHRTISLANATREKNTACPFLVEGRRWDDLQNRWPIDRSILYVIADVRHKLSH